MTEELLFGKCHVCRKNKLIRYCSACSHFFCEDCRSRYWKRGIEFVKELVGKKNANCCGAIIKLS